MSPDTFLLNIFHNAGVCQISYNLFFRYYGGQDEHQQEAVLRHEVEGRSGEVSFHNAKILIFLVYVVVFTYHLSDILSPWHALFSFSDIP